MKFNKFFSPKQKSKTLTVLFAIAIAFLIQLTDSNCLAQSISGNIKIEVDKNQISMGKSVIIDAKIIPNENQIPENLILLPFVNNRRWGAHEFPDENGHATFLLPMPNPGPNHIQILALEKDSDNWMGLNDYSMLKTGKIMPETGNISNTIEIDVKWRDIPEPANSETLFGMQWEPWFSPSRVWKSAQNVPIMGFYDSTDPNVLRQHILWFMDLGVDFIIPDWSNHIWGAKHWNERSKGSDMILHNTQIFLEVLADMRDEGLPVPKVAIMPGLSNGPPATMVALNEQLEWIYQDYIRNPRFKGLWQKFDKKPLIIILDTGVLAHPEGRTASSFKIPFFKQTMSLSEEEIDAMRKNQVPVDDSHFTIRWMSSQNQTTRHHELGYWSWMDGSLKPMVTYNNGKAESIAVTPAFFAEQGWTAPEAYGRRGGWTYIESFHTAFEHKPQVIMLHQFNEFTGQGEGHGYGPDKNIYVDSYSLEFSDDLEPVSLTTPGFRGDEKGYGFFYLNMTQALMDIYRDKENDLTIMAVHLTKPSNEIIKLEWSSLGVAPDSYTIILDGKIIQKKTSSNEYEFSSRKLKPGKHIVSVTANGVVTRYKLSPTSMDVRTKNTIPVKIEKIFIL